VSLFFAHECKGLLVGEGLLPEDVEAVSRILAEEPTVEAFKRPLSLYFGPSEVLVNLEVDFNDDLSSDDIEKAIDGIEVKIKERIPVVNRIFIEAETIRRSVKAKG
jgi:divalent metal cation (Fe/Co/Zn/Cd) transporter